MVEHHHFFGDAKRMVHGCDIEQRAETQALAPLRHRCQKSLGEGAMPSGVEWCSAMW
jgi:hypothetical protein